MCNHDRVISDYRKFHKYLIKKSKDIRNFANGFKFQCCQEDIFGVHVTTQHDCNYTSISLVSFTFLWSHSSLVNWLRACVSYQLSVYHVLYNMIKWLCACELKLLFYFLSLVTYCTDRRRIIIILRVHQVLRCTDRDGYTMCLCVCEC